MCDWPARLPVGIWGTPTFGLAVLAIALSSQAVAERHDEGVPEHRAHLDDFFY